MLGRGWPEAAHSITADWPLTKSASFGATLSVGGAGGRRGRGGRLAISGGIFLRREREATHYVSVSVEMELLDDSPLMRSCAL